MRRGGTGMVWLLGVACAAMSCRAVIGLEEAEPYPEQTSTGGAGAGGSSVGGTTSNTSTTSAGGMGGTTNTAGSAGSSTACEGLVNIGFGETLACQVCVATNCCGEYLDCIQNDDCDALWSCGGSGACMDDCLYGICGSSLGFIFDKYCTDCLSDACCDEATNCSNDTLCMSCVVGADPNACDATALDEDLETCTATNCSAQCDG